MHPTAESVQQSQERQGRVAALVLSLVMGGLSVYGFATGHVVVPTSNGRMILDGTAAYWAAAGQVLLALGLCSVPFGKAELVRWTVLGGLSFALGGILIWVGTLLN